MGLSNGAVKYIVKSEYEPKEVAAMVKEVLASYSNNKSTEPAPAPQ